MSYSQMSDLYQQVNGLQQALATVQTVETPGAYLTLTRSATLALATAGTSIVWQVETRNQNFTWSGDTITVPSDGYYSVSGNLAVSIATNTYIRMIYGTINHHQTYQTPFSTGGGYTMSYSWILYMKEADTFKIALTPAAACTLNQNGEYNAAPSPFVHVVQLSGVL